ncbi:glycoside hydrolase family 52 protein [Alicyclobacillus ferrooxydans]|uniref:glycoside hydrolase family 52 protein n=1 Tax=Alicyclobacillus ferrooxydans TaxID=471514 RepID=UPI000AD3D747|nr:glycoside hydrolase family 52 protein [Alicyclobacillus ferrooxydans]
MSKNIFFNAHHAPIGAYSSFTLGFPGAGGGLDLELGQSPRKSVYIGLETKEGGKYDALPFFDFGDDEAKRYDVEKAELASESNQVIRPIERQRITREFHLGSDTWSADDLTFTIYSPVQGVPDPTVTDESALKEVLVPAVIAELTVDNTTGNRKRRAFFGYEGNDPYSGMRFFNLENGLKGVGQGRITALIAADDSAKQAMHFSMQDILTTPLEENWTFGLGKVAAFIMDVPVGEKKTFRFAVCFYRAGIVTTGLDASYYYTRFFKNIEDVGAYAIANSDMLIAKAEQCNSLVERNHLSVDQQFMMAHAIRSYYGSSQLLDLEGRPFWVINEGEYRMMNTFDLTVDQLFYELKMNPWTVKNELDMFSSRYSYRDEVRFPGQAETHQGGLSFTHDMGIANQLSRPGYSSYEEYGLTGCFSHMTHEQLVNWVLCAAVYAEQTGDKEWLSVNLPILEACFESMLNRDNPDPAKRNGVMALDSSRTMGGAEITTYDSLDTSLGQARNNLYLASKSWAAYVGLNKLFQDNGQGVLAELALDQAMKCAKTIVSFQTEAGYIPAVMGENNDSKIIPAIEGLVFPYYMNCQEALDSDGQFGFFLDALKKHFEVVLVEDVCLFQDGGWKISSTSDNSWLSKVYLCQFVARQILGFAGAKYSASADEAHVRWLTHPTLSVWSWSDQMVRGEAIGSRYYPRGVTSILWLEEATQQ